MPIPDKRYGQMPQQKSFLSRVMPESIGGAYQEMLFGSHTLSALSYDNWNSFGKGLGFKYRGIIGFRGIAAGTKAYGGFASGMNPLRWGVEKGVELFGGPERAKAFKTGGLFAKDGLFQFAPKGVGKHAVGKGLNSDFLAAVFGGTPKGALKSSTKGMYNKILFGRQSPRGKAAEKLTSTAGKIVQGSYKEAFKTTIFGQGRALKSVRSSTEFLSGGELTKAGRAATSYVKKASVKKLVSGLGKGFNAAMWGYLGFQVGSAAVEGITGAASKFANRVEMELDRFGNRQMEFGGTFEAGFFSSGASTERQRALQAIHNSRANARGLVGNEASLSHVGNSW